MSSNNWEYIEYSHDPYGVRIYSLSNGLKVYLSKNNQEPRIKTRIVIKAGATSDPDDATGLAHYVEHMMFKGTDLIGALDRDKEASIISKIKIKYEELSLAETPEDISRINSDIDNLSRAASLEAVPGELDKLYSIMGCKNTNARTGFEETVYENDIPSVELERWLSLEKERFTSPVLRLFPPELEVVYEEFNQAQDDDVSRAYDALLESLFPKHPYGRAGILGKGEHLKKPSMEKIEDFLNTWYTPGNMAIVLTGDLDFDEAINLIDKYWGSIKQKKVPLKEKIIEEPLLKTKHRNVLGPDSPFVLIGYRFNGLGSDDELYLTLIDMIMSNNQAGLLDLNLVQKQKVLEAETSYEVYKDYSWFTLYGVPGKNQSLKSVAAYLLEEVQKLKKGDFESWYKDAVIRCFNIDKIQEIDGAAKIESFVDSFIYNIRWDDYINRIEKLNRITISDLINFISANFNNFSVIYKKRGQAKDLFQIDKPNLTPVIINREIESEFCKSFKEVTVKKNKPKFADYKSLDSAAFSNERKLYYCRNSNNDLFELTLISPIGRLKNLLIHYGSEFREFAGTKNYSGKKFQQALFKRGLDLVLASGDDNTTFTLSGLQEDFDEGLKLLKEFILLGNGSNKSFKKFLKRIIVLRKNAKNSKRIILWGGMFNYVHYGKKNPFKHYLKISEIRRIGLKEIVDVVKNTFLEEVEYYYNGSLDLNIVLDKINSLNESLPFNGNKYHLKKFDFIKSNNRFVFANYDMVQSEILLTARGAKFDLELLPVVHLFNEYFGGGMDSVVFQEVRERRGLAYSAYASYSIPKDDSGSFVFNFYIGTQCDKTLDAIRCVLGLLECFPKALNYFSAIKNGIIKNIESEALRDSDIYYSLRESRKFSLDCEIREFVYQKIQSININDLEKFFDTYIKKLKINTLILGNRKSINLKEIERMLNSKRETVSLKTLYGY